MGLPVSPGGSMMPPLQMSSSATSGPAQGGSATGGGMGTLNEGDWIIQTTGTGDNGATTGGKVNWLYIAAAAAAAWLLAKR